MHRERPASITGQRGRRPAGNAGRTRWSSSGRTPRHDKPGLADVLQPATDNCIDRR